MPLPSNTIAAGEHAYIIQSPNINTADCLIFAHGGSVGGQKFIVPAGKTIRFFANHNAEHNTLSGLALLEGASRAMRARGTHHRFEKDSTHDVRMRVKGGEQCHDYILAKALGSHGPRKDIVVSYQAMRDQMDEMDPGTGTNWVPHIVTIRNHTSARLHTNVWLSKLIKDVLDAAPQITTFYSANCRTRTSSSTLWLTAGNRVRG
jgi:hypothetical protein